MTAAPLVSVIIPTFNRSYFLRTRALRSLSQQTYENWEAIVVGDGPPDARARDAVRSMGDARFRYVEIPRTDYSGLSLTDRWCVAGAAARNRGLELANGAVIAPLDDDDEFLPDHLEESVRALRDGVDLVYGSVIVRDLEGGCDRHDFIPWDEALFRQRNILYHSSVCYSRELAALRYSVSGDVPADYAMWLAMLDAGARVKGLENDHALYYGDSRFRNIRSSIPSLPPLDAFQAAASDIFASRMLSNGGSWCRRLEREVAERIGVRYAIAAPSGDAALRLTLHALGTTAGQRNEVILPSYTFPATANAVLSAGLVPVFCDVDRESLTITRELVAPLLTNRTLALLPVHAHGNPVDMASLEDVVTNCGVAVVADAAAAFGARIHDRPIGSFGLAEIFSLSGTKVLAAGEGGIICTDDGELATLIHKVARYGLNADYWCETAGINGKLAELPAALGALGLSQLDGWLEQRRHAAAYYARLFSGVSGMRLQRPATPTAVATWKDLALIFDRSTDAARVVAHLRAHAIDSRPYYRPLHVMPPFAHCPRGDLTVTTYLVDAVVCVPIYASIRQETADLVAGVVMDALAS